MQIKQIISIKYTKLTFSFISSFKDKTIYIQSNGTNTNKNIQLNIDPNYCKELKVYQTLNVSDSSHLVSL